jgi:hypothetical protein
LYKEIASRKLILMSILSCLSPPLYAGSLQLLSDEELALSTGQALINLSYMAPGDTGNHMSGSNIGFYKLGMEASVELNANIRKLQLGCGGANGAGACDIDIDNLSLSGVANTREGRASSSAVLTNPFIEFAIKNPDKAATREVVGLRLSAEKIVGLLTTGTNNTTPNGINRLSGYMVINGHGTATTKVGLFGVNPGETINTVVDTTSIPLCTSGCGPNSAVTVGYGTSNNTGLTIPSVQAPFTLVNQVVTGKRLTAANVQAIANIPSIPITTASGQLGARLNTAACVILVACVQNTFVKLNTSLDNLKANISFSEGLGYIHNIPISSSGYLGLQSQPLRWPDAKETAEAGWWLSLQDPIDLGEISPQSTVDISGVFPQIASLLGTTLAKPEYKLELGLGDGINAILGQGITKTVAPLDLTGNFVNLPLSNLILSSQSVVPNCYGSLTFC